MISNYPNRMISSGDLSSRGGNAMNGKGGRYFRELDGTLYRIDEKTGERILIDAPVVGEQEPAQTETPDSNEE